MGLKATGTTRRQKHPSTRGSGTAAGGAKPAARRSPARPRRDGPGAAAAAAAVVAAAPFDHALAADWRAAVRATVEGLHYDVVDLERAPRGLLRVTIDRRSGVAYASAGDAVTVEDCEAVTRQLQYALEVDGVDYARLEVSSPGLDRPLRTEADYERFCGRAVDLTLKVPLQGRKHFQGPLGRSEGHWQVTFMDGRAEQVLSFALDEVREARLVPVVNFKGRQAPGAAGKDEGRNR